MAPFHRCPVCNSTLTPKKFRRALNALQIREQHLAQQKAALKKQLYSIKMASERDRDLILRKLARERALRNSARREATEAERARNKRLLAGKEHEISRLNERLKHVLRGSTPQTIGLEFEDKLAINLRRTFPSDRVEHRGKGGDVLHHVVQAGTIVGTIVYECKRTRSISSSHVKQTCSAKRLHKADFAVLVTTGRRRGFHGFTSMDSVLVVSPFGVVPLASLLRNHILEMARAKITKGKRALLAQRLLEFVNGPEFRVPLEDVIHRSSELESILRDEVQSHLKVWKRRQEHYQRVTWNVNVIRENVELLHHGKKPKSLASPPKSSLLPYLVDRSFH